MADSAVEITAGTGTNVDTRTEATNGNHRQVVVIGDPSTNAGVAPVDAANGLSVAVTTSALPTNAATSAKQDTIIGYIDGIETLLAGPIPISDNSGSLTVDDGGSTLSVDDGGGSLTVDFSSSTNAGATAKTADYDTGAGTDTVTMMGIALPASGGAVAGGTSSNPVRTDPTGTTAQPVTDNGGSLTVDGAVTANLGTLGGAATEAKQDSIIGYIDGIEGQLTTLAGYVDGVETLLGAVATETTLSAVNTKLDTIDNIVKAEDAAHTTGDSGVMALAVRNDGGSALAGTDGDYIPLTTDSTGALRVTGGGGGTEYTEGDTDATITGHAILWEDAGNTLATVSASNPLPVDVASGITSATEYTEGDVDSSITGTAILFEDTGDTLKVPSASNPLPVTVTNGASGGTAQADKSTFTEGTTNHTPIGGVYNETISADPTEDQAAAVRITAKRALHANLRNASGTEIGTSGNPVRIDPTGSTAQPVTDNGGSLTVDNGGTFAVQESGAALTSLQLIDDAIVADDAAFTPATTKVMMAGFTFDDVSPDSVNEGDGGAARMSANRNIYTQIRDAAGNERGANVNSSNQLSVSVDNTPTIAGNVAHDSADSGNPVKVGGKARQTNPTAVADADRTDLFTDDVGRPVVVMNQCRDLVGSQQTTITSSTSETTIVTAGGAGVFCDLTSLAITNSSATALIVTLKDATAGTTRGIYAIAANGGIVLTFPTPKAQASANNNWTLTCGSSVTSIYVVAEFVKNV